MNAIEVNIDDFESIWVQGRTNSLRMGTAGSNRASVKLLETKTRNPIGLVLYL